jgi:hypothetical protein
LSKTGSALTITLTLAFGAMHLAAPAITTQDEPTGDVSKPNVTGTTRPLSATRYTRCTAYLPAVGSTSYPNDENLGAAQSVLHTFFASVTPPKMVRYAIVLAPDPRHTNLSLMFDREITILQQAAQEEGYEYNSSWIPWKTEEPPPLDNLGGRQHQADLIRARESCPGVILFRKRLDPAPGTKFPAAIAYQEALIVFVVGEQATGGLNEDQWANAVQWLTSNASQSSDRNNDNRVLRILGPTFTGSLISLERDLEVIYAKKQPLSRRFTTARVFSGSVTGCATIGWFQDQLQQIGGGKQVVFGSFQENDSVHIFRFLNYLREQGTDLKDVAILSEDETAYAALPLQTATVASGSTFLPTANVGTCAFPYARENRPFHLVYPRDISALRDAYQKESIFNVSGGALNNHSTHPILPEATGPETGVDITDTVPTFSGSVSALSQEAYLFGAVTFMRAHHTRYLLLRCTNPLDFLFLTRFFHRTYPEARIVTVGSDLLFRREIDTTEFRGVLSLSSYPLLPLGQHWARITQDQWEVQPHDHLVFEGHLQEGMYIAARYLLHIDTAPGVSSLGLLPPPLPGTPLQLNRVVPTPDYAVPFWFFQNPPNSNQITTHPPTWLSAAGRDGYWPVAVLCSAPNNDCQDTNQGRLDLPIHWEPKDKLPNPSAPQSTMVKLIPQPASQHYELEAGTIDPNLSMPTPAVYHQSLLLSLPFPWRICAILSVGLVIYQLWGIKRGETHVSDGLFSVFYKATDPSHILLQGMSCALAILPLAEVTGVASIPAHLSSVKNSDYKVYILSIAVGVLFCILTPLTLIFQGQKKDRKYGVWAAVCFLVLLSLLLCLYSGAFKAGLTEVDSVPLFYRMTHITDGVSPLLPTLLITLGFYLWTWQAMAGNLLLTTGCPTLPEVENTSVKHWSHLRTFYHWLIGYAAPPIGNGANFLNRGSFRISQELGRNIVKIASPFCVSLRVVAVPALLLVAALLCVLPKNLPLLSLEGGNFNWIINGTLLLALLLIAAEAFRLYSTWVNLRKLLHALSHLRLRRTLARLRPISARSIWSVSGHARRFQYSLFTQQLDAANRLILLTKSSGCLVTLQEYGREFMLRAEYGVETGSRWNDEIKLRGKQPRKIRTVLADAVAEVYAFLRKEWEGEKTSLNLKGDAPDEIEATSHDAPAIPLSCEPAVRAAEEFVSYQYIAFIQNIVARMRTMTLSMIFLFVAACFAISFYPFVPRTEITVWMVLNLLFIGAAVAYVYAGMERDEILSYIADTKPGQLGAEFWVKLAGFLVVPVIGVLTTQFPSITDTVLKWLQPGLDAIK